MDSWRKEVNLNFVLQIIFMGSRLVPLDRDIRRRACMDPAGYWWRLYSGLVADSKYDSLCTDVTPDDAVLLFCRLAMFQQVFSGFADCARTVLTACISECLLLQWPIKWIAKIFCSFQQQTILIVQRLFD